MMIENLETRRLFAVTAAVNSGVLTIADDVITAVEAIRASGFGGGCTGGGGGHYGPIDVGTGTTTGTGTTAGRTASTATTTPTTTTTASPLARRGRH